MKQKLLSALIALLATSVFFISATMATEPKPHNSFSIYTENPAVEIVYEHSQGRVLLGGKVVASENDFFKLEPYVFLSSIKGISLGATYLTDSKGGDWIGGAVRVKSDRPCMGNFYNNIIDCRHPTFLGELKLYTPTDSNNNDDNKCLKEASFSFSLVRLGEPDAPPIRIVTGVKYIKGIARLVKVRPLIFELLLQNGRIRPFIGWQRNYLTEEGQTTSRNLGIIGITATY